MNVPSGPGVEPRNSDRSWLYGCHRCSTSCPVLGRLDRSHPERPQPPHDEPREPFGQQAHQLEVLRAGPHRVVLVGLVLALGLLAAEHRLALDAGDPVVEGGPATVVALEQQLGHLAVEGALLAELAQGRVGRRLAVLDPAARQHGVVAAVEVPADHQDLAVALDDGDRPWPGVRERLARHPSDATGRAATPAGRGSPGPVPARARPVRSSVSTRIVGGPVLVAGAVTCSMTLTNRPSGRRRACCGTRPRGPGRRSGRAS